MKEAIIINKLKEKGIIDSENNLNEELQDYVYLLSMYYPEDIAKQILESDLLNKYGIEILNECIGLRSRGKLINTRFEKKMPLEYIEIYCKIKQENPKLDIVKHDKYLYSINKEYLERYDIKDLGFIIEKINILSNYYPVDKSIAYNISSSQLDKLKRISEKNPDFKFEISDELFKLDEFWRA